MTGQFASGKRGRLNPAWIVLLAGVSAALHIGKLPPALPLLQRDLGITLVQSGFLLSLVQLASVMLGIVAGLAADGIGLRRCMLMGLWLLCGAGLAGGWARDAETLLALRALEGMGFLLTTIPAPSLVRRIVAPGQLTRMMGFWGAFMPFGTAMALLLGPLVMGHTGWAGWWWLTASFSAVMALWVQARLPPDERAPAQASVSPGTTGWTARLAQTLQSGGPWLMALTFATYSAQWLAVIGFLPSLYAQSGWTGVLGAVLTALVAAVNIIGNVAAGRLLHRGVPARALLWTGFAVMGVGAFLAFSSFTDGLPVIRYSGALLFSSVGGLIPGTLFGLASTLAPSERTISTTVGWMMQWSAAGQLAGPPLVAWVASRMGNWQWTWAVTGSGCVAGMLLAAMIARRLAAMARSGHNAV
ncbi:CynX/NimT family MFS transporter [Ottowia sp. VDI28]|uniref:MFS transporter n=1 Tax=Ottowia sp. VDI28 TaxID=3133968 RepID=UPI003C2C352D